MSTLLPPEAGGATDTAAMEGTPALACGVHPPEWITRRASSGFRA
ncbi:MULTISPECIES: hypothetical protein [unclassified Streptomyces]|nr:MULTISPECIES: hypothetical protein [unclassified Streptomyces]MCX5440220.1 hypothetical protein [Streptomyces sp. NBC_00063]WSE17732.1 hypothetical protein OG518_32760 [Streptomyces sp. NBC_01397]WUB93374.1 hypothetical protein OHO83_14280 [Streptomyces sp. NBC_00569]